MGLSIGILVFSASITTAQITSNYNYEKNGLKKEVTKTYIPKKSKKKLTIFGHEVKKVKLR